MFRAYMLVEPTGHKGVIGCMAYRPWAGLSLMQLVES